MDTLNNHPTKFIAFLRAINVGGHNVKMDYLRQLFQEIGFSQVESFIASGNLIFEAATTNSQQLVSQIEPYLQQKLGYAVATFIRTPTELAAIATYRPFAHEGTALLVAFLAQPPSPEGSQKVMALKNRVDDFQIHGREIYWLCQTKQSESTFSGNVLEKAIGVPATLRSWSTIQKIAAKYPA